jgi:hypothetical protein
MSSSSSTCVVSGVAGGWTALRVRLYWRGDEPMMRLKAVLKALSES